MPDNVLMIVSILVSFTTLVTFIVTQRQEAEKRGARAATLDNAISQIQEAVDKLVIKIADQDKRIGELSMCLELLLQQHQANHNQTIRRNK